MISRYRSPICQVAITAPTSASGPRQAEPLVRAAGHAFAHAVAHTSLVGGIILGAGTVLVALLLPGTRGARSGHGPVAGTGNRNRREVQGNRGQGPLSDFRATLP
jgi:hypothetical protein